MSKTRKFKWWEKGIIYQIYPRSFKDTNGDGIGDLPGITEKLDYLKDLGIQGIWISPFYPSPMADFGYDVSDYRGIHPSFGSMEDFDKLIKEVHQRDLKLILDFVPNHTSEAHPWFKESRKSKDNPKRNWYIWKDPKPDGSPPNNWLSEFGGGAWEYDEKTEQYYYHAYLKEQPDLNWRNPDVQEAMLDNMRFWLEKGVDGFRVDVMWHIMKDGQFRDNPPNPDYDEEKMSPYRKLLATYSTDQPEVHDIVAQMRNLLDEFGDRVLIGEIYLPINQLVAYYGRDNSGAHLPFNFQLIKLDWDAEKIGAAIDEYEGSLPEGGWPNWVLGNHDKSRVASRVGLEQARVAAMLLLTSRGTPTMYYGDEIGMLDVPIAPEEVQDPHEKNVPGKGLGRDPERTPMQWDSSKNAGFTHGEPWLPLMHDYENINVEAEWDRQGSMLQLYRKLINFRQQSTALTVGKYYPVHSRGGILAYSRKSEDKEFLIILNFRSSTGKFEPDLADWKGKVVISTDPGQEGEQLHNLQQIKANLGLLIELEK